MSTTKMTLKEMISAAMLPENEELIMRLLERIESPNVDIQELRAEAETFDSIFESWSEEITASNDKAGLCIKLAELGILDTPNFRSALHFAVRKLLPPYLASGSVIKAIGAKDSAVSVRDVALRLRKLQHLRSTAVMYQQENHQWSRINSIDKVTGVLAISGLHSSSSSSVPIASAVITAHFFNTTPDFLNLLFPDKVGRSSSAVYRTLFAKNSLSELSEQKIHDIVNHLMVPAAMSQEAFDAWWTADTAKPAAAGERTYAEARSILELHKLITEATKDGSMLPVIDEEKAVKLKALFQRIRKDIPAKDNAMLMECAAQLAVADSDLEILRDTFAPIRGKAAFWPAVMDEHMDMRLLDSWGHLSVKLLPAIVKVTNLIYDEREMFIFATLLPLRCTAAFMDKLPDDAVAENLLKMKNLSSDLIMWIWKNRSHLNPHLVESIDMGKVVSALSVENLPREWIAAQRELKKFTFEKDDFQKFLIDNANGDIPSIISAIQRCRSFQGGERQSVMVKFARHSEELKNYIEAGEGRKVLGAQAKTVEQAPVTSIKSHKRLADELEDLITVQIPKNAEQVAIARSFGDLRENAEYDAAKEKRRYLHHRRAELEKILGFIQSTDFKDVRIDGHVVIGSLVRLQSVSGGEDKEFYLLGAWDGDPEKNQISYKTRIGEVLLDQKIGAAVTLPEGGSFTIKEVLPLPEDLRKELASED